MAPIKYVRQSSHRDESGDAIPGTARIVEMPHALVRLNSFFPDLDALIKSSEFHSTNPHTVARIQTQVRRAIDISREEGVGLLEATRFMQSYFRAKRQSLVEGKTTGLGQKIVMQPSHMYIVTVFDNILEKIVRDLNAEIASAAASSAEAEEKTQTKAQ